MGAEQEQGVLDTGTTAEEHYDFIIQDSEEVKQLIAQRMQNGPEQKEETAIIRRDPVPVPKRTEQQMEQRPKQKRRSRPNFGQEYVEPGDNTEYLKHALYGLSLPPIDKKDPKQVEERIKMYFQYCLDNDRKPNIKGLGNWLGVSRDTVHSWMRGEFNSRKEHQEIIQKAYDIIEEMWWDYGQNGKVNPAAWIFVGKNAFGMRDTQDVVITPNNPLGNTRSAEEIAQEYTYLPEE